MCALGRMLILYLLQEFDDGVALVTTLCLLPLLQVGLRSPWFIPESPQTLGSFAARPLDAVGAGPLVGVLLLLVLGDD